jgi:plasmid stability protein
MTILELQLPHDLEEALKARATAHARSVEDEARLLLTQALHWTSALADEALSEQLDVLDDEQLWQVARQQVSTEKSERMQALLDRQRTEGLSPEEADEAARLQRYAQRVMLLRAEAAALLKRRGHKVESLRVQP